MRFRVDETADDSKRVYTRLLPGVNLLSVELWHRLANFVSKLALKLSVVDHSGDCALALFTRR